jgi:hypothetical protein
MIIAIASDDGMNVAQGVGRDGGFVVFEIGLATAMRVGYRSNAWASNGVENADAERRFSDEGLTYGLLVSELSDCQALVSRSMDDALLRELWSRAIEAYVCPEGSVDQAARLFAQGRLRKLDGKACRVRR